MSSDSQHTDTSHRDGSGPLAGLRVVDLTTSYAGPTASMYLADLGADVIKVERPGGGDDARAWGPPFVDGTSAWFASANRNKRSVVIDLRSVEGLEVLRSLAATADVFMQWKGTDACLDLNCDCGTSSHVDGLFAYYVRCPGCLSIYEMPHDLTARKINPATDGEYAGQFLQGEVE